MPRFLFTFALVVSAAAFVSRAAAQTPAATNAAKPKITISKETTYITTPLRADGYPDFAAALDERMSQGVTLENNAAVLLQKAFGPTEIPPALRASFFKRLGIPELPAEGNYLVDQDEMVKRWRVDHPRPVEEQDDEKINLEFDHAMERPWTEREFPMIAQWLKLNEQPLRLALEASQKPKRFFPIILEPNAPLIGLLLVHDQQLRDIARLLVTRAMLETARGNNEAAWKDLLATHRLARLTANTSLHLVGMLIGYAIEGVAMSADLAFLHSAKLSAEEIKKFRVELAALPSIGRPTEALSIGERFWYLDAVSNVARDGLGALRELSSGSFGPNDPKDRSASRKALDELGTQMDWDLALRTGNEWFDRLAVISRIEDREQSKQARNKFDEDVRRMAADVKNPRSFTLDLLTKGNVGDLLSPRISKVFIALLLPATSAVMVAYERTQMFEELNDTAFALAEYRARQGKYPEKLSDLVPQYLTKVPDDVFKQPIGPIGYRREGDAYILWTAFMDGIDSGANEDDSDDFVLRPVPKKAAEK